MRRERPRPTAASAYSNGTNPALLGITAVIAIVLIFLSPLALGFLARGDTDWAELSLIGQSYGAISAILAAFAVIGVVLTLRLQQQQLADGRRLAVREQQRQLTMMAMEDPELQRVWGNVPLATEENPRLSVYTNLVLNYFILLHDTGNAGLNEIRIHLRAMSDGDYIAAYWASTRHVWVAAYPVDSHPVVAIMDEEFSTARMR